MIRVSMTSADVRRVRFALSPLGEVAASLHMIASGLIHPVHRRWLEAVRDQLRHVDMPLLTALVPAKPVIADFFFSGVADTSTSIKEQLRLLADTPGSELRREIEAVWQSEPIPDAARGVADDANGGARRLANALWRYWSVALEPHWSSMRALLDEDVAFRATELTKSGLAGMLGGLHQSVALIGNVLYVDKRASCQQQPSGAGLLLVPSVFAWPKVILATSESGPWSLTYGARGVGNLWTRGKPAADDDALGALLGRSRAAILGRLGLPASTTELALKLGQSPPAVSQHLAVLRRSALVTSWRSGRRVLYRRTALGDSVVSANPASSPRHGSTTGMS